MLKRERTRRNGNEGPCSTSPNWEPQWGAAVSVDSPQANTFGRSLPRADKALLRRAPLFLAIFLVVFVLTLTLNRETDPIHPFRRLARSPETVRWTILAALTVLAANNITKIPITLGFDAYYHLEYIEYVARTWRVPLADEGWQMFQSPLYYFLSALLYHLFSQFLSLARTDEALRILPLICGIMQVEVCYRMLKQTYPGQRTLQSLGLVLGGLLPINVYLSQSLSNEPLAALFTSLAILAAIRLQYAPRDNWPLRTFLLLGALLGLALLTKVSAILLCPPLFLLIIFTAHDKHSTTAKTVTASAQALGVVFGLAFLVCGWYYIRNWIALGAPFVGGWENTRGFT